MVQQMSQLIISIIDWKSSLIKLILIDYYFQLTDFLNYGLNSSRIIG